MIPYKPQRVRRNTKEAREKREGKKKEERWKEVKFILFREDRHAELGEIPEDFH